MPTDLMSPIADDPLSRESETPMFAKASRYAGGRNSDAPSAGALAPMAIFAGMVLLAGVAAAGWYVSQHNQGMAQLTPGSPAPVTDTAAAPPVSPPLAQNEPALRLTVVPTPVPAAAEPQGPSHSAMASVTHRTPAKARTASRSAEANGVNASATVPAPTPAPAPVNPIIPSPVQAAPTPAPTPPAPPVTDAPTTPPVQTPPQ